MKKIVIKLSFILMTLYLFGCETPPYNLKLECEVVNQRKSVQVVKYEVDAYHWNPHVAGHFNLFGVIYKSNRNKNSYVWLLEDLTSDFEYIKNKTCEQSIIKNDAVIVSPVKLTMYISKNIYWNTTKDINNGLNIFLFKPAGKNNFSIIKAPNKGFPHLLSDKGDNISRWSWVNRSFDYVNGSILVTQVGFLKKPFDSYYAKNDYFTPFQYSEGREVRVVLIVNQLLEG